MVKCTVIERESEVLEKYIVKCSTGDMVFFEDIKEAMCFASTAEKCCRGGWQLRLLLRLWRKGELPAAARRLVRGRAASYVSWYQKQLDKLAESLGAAYYPGPRGGRWCGKYVWRWRDAMEQRQMPARVPEHLVCEEWKEGQ